MSAPVADRRDAKRRIEFNLTGLGGEAGHSVWSVRHICDSAVQRITDTFRAILDWSSVIPLGANVDRAASMLPSKN